MIEPNRIVPSRRRIAGIVTLAAATALGLPSLAAAAVKKVAYPEVKVELAAAFQPDPAFNAMTKKLADAVAKKDQTALFSLVGPTFVWTLEGALTDELDLGRDALHNFKVVFGFRAVGADKDGGVDQGPFWDGLAALIEDKTYYKATDSGNLICAPTRGNVADQDVFDQARNKIEGTDEGADWYFTLAPTNVAKAPNDKGPPVAKVGTIALPVLSTSPAAKPNQPAPPAQFLEVLLPSAKTGWIPAAAARPLSLERLCYAKTAAGEWKIVGYDQPQQ
jgi:hypothetical protein